MFLRLLTKKHNIIKNIMKLRIKNHFSHEGHIDDEGINQAEYRADSITVSAPPRNEQAWQCHQNQRNNEDIGIEIHAPPKTETVAFAQGPFLPCQRGIRLMDCNENSPKNSTQNREKNPKFDILLNRQKKMYKHHNSPLKPRSLLNLFINEHLPLIPYGFGIIWFHIGHCLTSHSRSQGRFFHKSF